MVLSKYHAQTYCRIKNVLLIRQCALSSCYCEQLPESRSCINARNSGRKPGARRAVIPNRSLLVLWPYRGKAAQRWRTAREFPSLLRAHSNSVT